jgi:hypothetical protein
VKVQKEQGSPTNDRAPASNAEVERLVESMRLCTGDSEQLKRIARQLWILDEYTYCEEALRRALAVTPRDPQVWLSLAEVFKDQGNYLQAQVAARYARQFTRSMTYEAALLQVAGLVVESYIADTHLQF